ncbi:protein CutA homolog isoform X1 [Eleutherodactylus coqui]|uniref:protein CutA homolog isoform X1 n=1 Tax=Eleutherodactylus coqui TaxID=57060 RepID=UPI00346380D0
MGCQAPSQNWLRSGWMTAVLVMVGSSLLYPILWSIFWQVYGIITGSYISGSHSVAFINCPNEQIAREIARGILEKKLAASVNIMPKSSSLYIWKGEIEESSEVLLVVKTRTAKLHELSGYVRFVHPFEAPDFMSVPIDRENLEYSKYIDKVTARN